MHGRQQGLDGFVSPRQHDVDALAREPVEREHGLPHTERVSQRGRAKSLDLPLAWHGQGWVDEPPKA